MKILKGTTGTTGTTVNIASIIKRERKKVSLPKKKENKVEEEEEEEEEEDVIHDRKYLKKLEGLLVNLTGNEMLLEEHTLPPEFEKCIIVIYI